MNAPPADSKKCPMCCLDIPQQARKCPFCLHLQKYKRMPGINPILPLAIFSALPLSFFFFMASVFSRGEDFEKHSSQITTADTEIVFGDSKAGPTVAVMGIIKNTSTVPWKGVNFHVDFMDATGKRVDVGEKEDYFFHLPAQGTSTFKISFRREFPEEGYREAAVRVVGARDARSRF